MTENSKIQWTNHTFNPWLGCEKISPACDHCYAESWAKRIGRGNLWQGMRSRTSEANWREPIKWNRKAEAAGVRARVFCASLADVFDNAAPDAWRADLFALIRATPHLDWLLLTKRIGNARKMIEAAADWHFDYGDRNVTGWLTDWYKHGIPPDNVWLGATIANQDEADRDIPKLVNSTARVRFLSMEPLLGAVDLSAHFFECCGSPVAGGEYMGSVERICCLQPVPTERIHWVIVGGESGHGARSMVLGWAKDLVRQCKAAGVAVFVKQLGAKPVNREGVPHPVTDKGGDMAEWPEVLRVREFPA